MFKKRNTGKYFSGSALARLPLYKLVAGGTAVALCASVGLGVMAAGFTVPTAAAAAPTATPQTPAEPVFTQVEYTPEAQTPVIEMDVSVVQQDVGVQLYGITYEVPPIFYDPEEEAAYVPVSTKTPLLGVEAAVTLTDAEGNAQEYTIDPETGTALAENVDPGDYTVSVAPVEGYLMPGEQSVAVKEKVVYKADINAVKDKIVQSSQVNESAEDSGTNNAGAAPIAEEVTDTVTYVESSKNELGSGSGFAPTLSASGHMLLNDGTETPYLPVYENGTKNLIGAMRDPNYQSVMTTSAQQPSGLALAAPLAGSLSPRALRMHRTDGPLNEENAVSPQSEEAVTTGDAVTSVGDATVLAPAESTTPTEAPTAAPPETPTETPTETPPEQPPEMPTAAPIETPVETPTTPDFSSEGSTGGALGPESTPADAPPETPAPSAPGEAPSTGQDATTGWPDEIALAELASYGFALVESNVTRYEYSGWQEIDGVTYYYDPATHQPVTGSQVIQGNVYTFGADGALNRKARGIDVSKFQGSIDWNAVKSDGITFAIIRCGYRGYGSGALVEDSSYRQNIQGAIAAGLQVGVYFYSQAINEEEAVEEASMVLSLVSGYSLPMGVYYDTEKVDGGAGRADGLSAAQRTACAVAFCETIRGGGYTPGVYSYASWFYNGMNFANISKYRIWIAQYRDTLDFSYKYNIWQYTGSGSVKGISKKVDMNIG